jgi:hypothetical protein
MYSCDNRETRIQDFKLGRGALKKIVPSGGRLKIFGVFRVKNHDFTPKNHIFSNFRGGARRVRPPPPLKKDRHTAVALFVPLIFCPQDTPSSPSNCAGQQHASDKCTCNSMDKNTTAIVNFSMFLMFNVKYNRN